MWIECHDGNWYDLNVFHKFYIQRDYDPDDCAEFTVVGEISIAGELETVNISQMEYDIEIV